MWKLIHSQKDPCCAICRYWYGEAVINYHPETGMMIFDDRLEDFCELHQKEFGAGEKCDSFVLEYLYSK